MVVVVQKVVLKMVRVPYPLNVSPVQAPEQLACVPKVGRS